MTLRGLSPEELISLLRDTQGYTDDEIADHFIRAGMAIRETGGRLEWWRGDSKGLYQQRLVKEWLRRSTAAGQPTPWAREKIAQLPDAFRALQRNSRRGANKSAVAARLGINRDTLHDWIKRGWVTWPPS